MAPRAAARLESLGFKTVYEYKAGKQDWLACGLPAEGRRAAEPNLASVARTDVLRFGLQDRAGPMAVALEAANWDWAAVVDHEGVLLGRVRLGDLTDPAARAEDVMKEGPSTYRLDVELDEMLHRMDQRHFDAAFVTDPDGRLYGLVTRRDITAALDTVRRAS